MITILTRDGQGGYTFPTREAADWFIQILIRENQEHSIDPKALEEYHTRHGGNYQPKKETR